MSLKIKNKIKREEKEWNAINQALDTSGVFIGKNYKIIFSVLLLAIIAVGVLVAYRFLVSVPKNESALNAMIEGQNYFKYGQDSLALYGDGNGYIGFDEIIKEYGSTPAAKVARYDAAICAYNLGEYDKALKYAKEFKADDIVMQYLAKGIAGDCLVNLGKPQEAIPYFISAAEGLDDVYYSPVMYKKAALVYKSLNNYDKVIELFTHVKSKYSTLNPAANSPIVNEAGKYIEEAQLLKNAN